MRLRICIIAVISMALACPVNARDKVVAAVAVNFMMPLNEMIPLFEKETGFTVEPVFASSGKLYSQITNGAPYDVFLSADEDRPAGLFKNGLVERPFVYARGAVVLWARDKKFCKSGGNWTEVLKSKDVKKIALANPETAPYGKAALKALKAAGLAEALKEKIVYPQDVGQSFQYASTGAVDMGFCALSSALTPKGMTGCVFMIKEAPQVVQAACIVKGSKHGKAAGTFMKFLLSAKAGSVKEKYGYR